MKEGRVSAIKSSSVGRWLSCLPLANTKIYFSWERREHIFLRTRSEVGITMFCNHTWHVTEHYSIDFSSGCHIFNRCIILFFWITCQRMELITFANTGLTTFYCVYQADDAQTRFSNWQQHTYSQKLFFNGDFFFVIVLSKVQY